MQSIQTVRARLRARTTARAVAIAAGAAVGSIGLCVTAVVAIGTHPVVAPPVATRPAAWQPQQPLVVPDDPVDQPVPDVPLAWPEIVVSGPGGSEFWATASGLAAQGIPATALAAYQHAQVVLAQRRPGCGLNWSVPAAIGRVESNHGRFGGAVLTTSGRSVPPVRGPRLDGGVFALIRDTDGGRLDGDTAFDRAVGPMQFLPSTWRAIGADGNGDGVADPDNIYDAAVTAGVYLCSGSARLGDPAGLRAAVFRYNHSESYVDLVVSLAGAYRTGVGAALGGGTAPVRTTTSAKAPVRTTTGTSTRVTTSKPSATTTTTTRTTTPATTTTTSGTTTTATPTTTSSAPSTSQPSCVLVVLCVPR